MWKQLPLSYKHTVHLSAFGFALWVKTYFKLENFRISPWMIKHHLGPNNSESKAPEAKWSTSWVQWGNSSLQSWGYCCFFIWLFTFLFFLLPLIVRKKIDSIQIVKSFVFCLFCFYLQDAWNWALQRPKLLKFQDAIFTAVRQQHNQISGEKNPVLKV